MAWRYDQHLELEDMVTLTCREIETTDDEPDELTVSTAEIDQWDLPSLLNCKLVQIKANRDRLIRESDYFRGLLCGSFSEKGKDSLSVSWDIESLLSVLRVIFGCQVEISASNFVSLYEAALFFGVDKLLLSCRAWLNEVTSFIGPQSSYLRLDGLIHIWEYGLENANDYIMQLCEGYLARNFMWASSSNSFTDVPEKLLCACTQHSDLTIDSEMRLCNAILVWLTKKSQESESWSSDFGGHKIRGRLLPSWFAAGKRRCHFFSKIVDESPHTIVNSTRSRTDTTSIFEEDALMFQRIRLTKYTQKMDVSGCPHITLGVFIQSVLPPSIEGSTLRKIMKKSSINHTNSCVYGSRISQELGKMLTFESVEELDISNCSSLSLNSAIDCLCKAFPSLKILRAAYFLNFKTIDLYHLVLKFPLLIDIDLNVDVDPLIMSKVSIKSSSTVQMPLNSRKPVVKFPSLLTNIPQPIISNVTKLSLEGRTDIGDADLITISEICNLLNYINVSGCISVSDHGISEMIMNCKTLQSILACDTLFGDNSIQALCFGASGATRKSAYTLLTLHIGGCNGVNGMMLSDLMSGADCLKSLCLREIQLVDEALYKFSGVSLEVLDISGTEVSSATLSHVIQRNPHLRSLKTKGCRHLSEELIATKEQKLCYPSNLYSYLGKFCKLEEIELGWGFSYFSLEVVEPAMRTLKTLSVGLGGVLGLDGLKLIPTICPLLETLILYFQMISDSALTNITRSLPYLRHLALCYCSGDISSLSFKVNLPSLRNLKLDRVTPWMNNNELANLTENCPNLVELSLTGCVLLDSESQAIISSGWPGLTSLHLEECGEITANGVSSLLDCYALEDLKLRHTGSGLAKNIIIEAACKLPNLRKLSLDLCDAEDDNFDIPNFAEKSFLSWVKIARCKLQRKPRAPVHRETLVLVWNSERLTRTMVKERL